MGVKNLFCIVLLFFFCFNSSFARGNKTPPLAVNGVIDLRTQSLNNIIELNGQWEFYWNQLLSPDTIPTAKDKLIVDFPFKWNGFELNGRKLPSFGYATYRLKILLPRTSETLRISMPDVYCAYKLFINDELCAENGNVSSDPKEFVPYWHYNTIDLPGELVTAVITLQVANFVHSKGGVPGAPAIGKKSIMKLEYQRSQAINFLLTGCLFMGGFFFMGLYLLGNRDKAILLFSLFSIIYSYRIIGTDNYELHTLLPAVSWYITVRLEYISLFAGIGLFALYTKYLYPKDVNKIVVNIVAGICLAFSVVTLFFPPLYFTQLINPFLLLTIFCLGYLPYVYFLAYRNKRPGSIFSIWGSVALMPVFTISLLHYWNIIPSLPLLSFAGYVIFFFLQSMVLSNRVSFILKEARIEAEQGLKAKSEFLSTMSHEIRTPLNSVIGMSHFLLQNHPRKDQIEQLEVLHFSANNLLSIVNDILDYSKIEAGKISFENIEMDIARIARNIIKGQESQALDKGIDLRLYIDPVLEKTTLTGDPTRIYQVISNLVHNAIKFTNSGFVELNISTAEEKEDKITIKTEVKDTGIGIPKEKQTVIFDRFTQADSSTSRGFGGTGLGLSICKKILELQGSDLHVTSEEGKGSVFYFTQAFKKGMKTINQQPGEYSPHVNKDKPFEGFRILLVEDNPMNIMVAKTFLQRWGAQADVASNGLEALNIIDQQKHHLVLMDIHMPVMNGYESAKRMRTGGISVPIIALTADLPRDIEEQVKLAGIDDILLKPFEPDELYKKVLYYISSRQQT